MEEQRRREESFSIQQQQPPWMIPQTPTVDPIYPYTVVEEEHSHRNQVEERGFDMSGLDHLSFGDLLALSNTRPVYFSGQTSWPCNALETTRAYDSGLMIRDNISPICPNTVEEQAHWNQLEERRLDMSGLDQLSFGDFLALSNNAPVYCSDQTTPWASNPLERNSEIMQQGNEAVDCLSTMSNDVASVYFSGQTPPWVSEPTRNTEIMQKGNEAVEILSSVSNNVAEQFIKTPDKPKKKKHRPKVVREAKPKKAPKPPAPRKSVVVDGQESKTPRRKYVRKKVEVNKDQESTPVEPSAPVKTPTRAKKLCRRVLDFEPENGDETESAPREKMLGSTNQESKDCLLSSPSTTKRKRSQGKRKDSEPKKNVGNQEGVDLSIAQAAKRRQAKEPTCGDLNLSGIQYDEVCDYQKMNWLHFPNLQQEGIRSEPICSTPLAGQQRKDVSAFDYNCYGFTSQLSADTVLTTQEKREGICQGRKQFEFNVLPDKIDTPIKTTRSKKKRVTKSKKSQTKQKTLLPNHCQFPASFSGLSQDELWKQPKLVEAISEQLRILDINMESCETAIVPYSVKPQENQLVLYGGGAGAIVPITPVKKRRPRPKVDLDDETEKVWRLLLENINSEGIDGSDEKKAKWWEEERNVFRGRADSFIARMHLVQGDRRFTPWKGSVVDSVVGVFLTQNVSDHLSSSAFMSLASEFPVTSVPGSNFDVGTSSTPSIQITYLDSEESMSSPPGHSQCSVILKNTEPDEEKDYEHSNETSRSSSEIASSAHESVCKTTDSKMYVESDRKGSSVEVGNTDQECLILNLFPSEDSALTFQRSTVSDAPQNTERPGSSSEISLEGEYRTSYLKLLLGVQGSQEEPNQKSQCDNSSQEIGVSSNHGSFQVSPNMSPGDCSSEVKNLQSLKGTTKSSDDSYEPHCSYQQDGGVLSCQKHEMPERCSKKHKGSFQIPDLNESTSCIDVIEDTETPPGPDSRPLEDSSCKELNPIDDTTLNAKGKKVLKQKKEAFDWDSSRREAQIREGKREKSTRTMDSVDWEAIRTVDVSVVAETIKKRGMNHMLAERIQGFLNRLVIEHGSIDLEWLRDIPPDKAKEYLLSFRGLGLKSVECVRLLTLHHLAFPVDTNVARIAVRLGWVPLQPLPESLQLHLLEMYPILESIQKYLWPRLCKLDQKTLYELHYQMITFGKVFCTKSKPNCNACPMRGECRHFASAFASARLALPGTEKYMGTPDKNPSPLYLPEPLHREQGSEVVKHSEPANKVKFCEPIIEEPASPEPESAQVSIADIEDAFFEDPEEIPTIRLNTDAFTSNLKKIMEHNKELQVRNMSTALVALTAEAASLPMPKLKNISQLRTEHQVYELPDSHPLLVELEKREPDDPCSYLLAIWTPGETADSIQPSVSKCISQANGKLCDEETCFSCNNIKEARSQTVRGTILIPCRTAMRGSFPLNGTYFQVNEVFADHASSLDPIDVPREWLWDLHRRTVYFGTSIPTIFKGLPTETIQQCFWRGYVCVRGFDRKTRGPKPLIARLHFPVRKMKSRATESAK
ncbi:PREDICTED: protein ROS1-like isoform X2 [Camelina sativa]|uniref:Protein ROS1-like isoform X2 n=1 Tax=Camelina sativa TaxID=90675 RepID=A0ABM0ZK43_CAMSA|nr:PREDICTED: protein ROS1-like isoform X2 [Camelina sativa]